MRETKFTPGPWSEDSIGGVVHAGEMRVCDVRGWGWLTGQGGLKLSPQEAEQIQDANAHLIAAAPDLYAALLRIQEDHGPCGYGSGKRRPEDDNVIHVAESCRGCLVDKILAKARGEP